MKVGLFQPAIPSGIQSPGQLMDVRFRDENGNAVNLRSLRNKVVFINFWATWCPPCIAELPSINDLYMRLRDNRNVVFLIVDADGDFGKSRPFIAKHQYSLPLYQIDSTVPAAMLGNTIPTTVVINKHGEMVYHAEGAADYSSSRFINWLSVLSARQ